MEKYGNVIASIQGHHHDGHYSFRNGIHYWTMKGMITGAYPSHNSYAIVEVSPDGDVAIKGFGDAASMFLGASDERDRPSGVEHLGTSGVGPLEMCNF